MKKGFSKEMIISEQGMKSNFRIKLLTLGFLISLFFTSFTIFSQEKVSERGNEKVSFDGVIVNSEGRIIETGYYDMVFSLYLSSEGGSPVWSEIHSGVEVINGNVNVQLRMGQSDDQFGLEFDKMYYLGIKVGSDKEIEKRLGLTSVPYSFRTKITEEVPDGSITNIKIADNSITDDKIESLNWNKITGTEVIDLSPKSIKVLPDYWRRHGNYLDIDDPFLGTINDRNLVVRTDSIQRMLIDPYGKIILGTEQDSVFFEVIGKTTLADVYVKNYMGVGVDFDNTKSKLHVNSTGALVPFLVEYNNDPIFEISSDTRVKITSTVSGGEESTDNYPLYLDGVEQGIAIEVNGSSSSDHNYISFWDDAGMAGRIEGQTELEYLAEPLNIAHDIWLAAIITAGGVAAAASALEAPDIVAIAAEIIYWGFELTWAMTHLGVTYESASGDYAEWLQKSDVTHNFTIGDVVGVFGGKISLNTKGAHQIMTISTSPIILGNMPAKGREEECEKVAFKGQVPVKVLGLVNKGDYIIPSGFNDGIGIPISPYMMTIDEFSKTIGKAWESSQIETVKLVNVAVGLNLRELTELVQKSFHKTHKLQEMLNVKNEEILLAAKVVSNVKSDVNDIESKMNLINNVIYSIEENNKTKNSKNNIQTTRNNN